MQVRKIRRGDSDHASKVLGDGNGSEYKSQMSEELNNVIKGKGYGFVVDDNGDILGYAACSRTVQTYSLGTIVVRKDKRSQGVGTLLLGHIIDYFREIGDLDVLNVVTDADARDVISFYLRSGFEISGYVDDEFIPGVRQVHLKLNLKK